MYRNSVSDLLVLLVHCATEPPAIRKSLEACAFSDRQGTYKFRVAHRRALTIRLRRNSRRRSVIAEPAKEPRLPAASVKRRTQGFPLQFLWQVAPSAAWRH